MLQNSLVRIACSLGGKCSLNDIWVVDFVLLQVVLEALLLDAPAYRMMGGRQHLLDNEQTQTSSKEPVYVVNMTAILSRRDADD